MKNLATARMMTEDEKSEILVSGGLPSIFELVARDSLSVSIQQAVQHIVKVRCLFPLLFYFLTRKKAVWSLISSK